MASGDDLLNNLSAVNYTNNLPWITSLLAGPQAQTDANTFVGPQQAGAASSGGSGNLLGSILGTAQNLAPVLGGAAKGQLSGEQANYQLGLGADQLNNQIAQLNTTLPAARLRAAEQAGLLNTYSPVSVSWGGPGSGLKGQVPRLTGGVDPSKMPAMVRSLANQVQMSELQNQLGGNIPNVAPPNIGGSTGDQILGGAAAGTSILGALAPLLMLLG